MGVSRAFSEAGETPAFPEIGSLFSRHASGLGTPRIRKGAPHQLLVSVVVAGQAAADFPAA